MVIWRSCGSFAYLYHHILYTSSVVAVQLKQMSYTVSEGNGTVTVCSVVSNITEQDVRVVISTQPDSAEGQLVCHLYNYANTTVISVISSCIRACRFQLTSVESDF